MYKKYIGKISKGGSQELIDEFLKSVDSDDYVFEELTEQISIFKNIE